MKPGLCTMYSRVHGQTLAQAQPHLRRHLRQRLTVYPEYIVHKSGFMAPALEPRLRAMVDEDGYPLDDEKGVASP